MDSVVAKPGMPMFFEKDKIKYFNRFLEPAWNLEKLENFVKDNSLGNLEVVEKWIHGYLLDVVSNSSKSQYLWLCNYFKKCLFDQEFKPTTWPVLYSKMSSVGRTVFIKKVFQEFMGGAFAIKNNLDFKEEDKSFVLVDDLCEIKKMDNRFRVFTLNPEYSKINNFDVFNAPWQYFSYFFRKFEA